MARKIVNVSGVQSMVIIAIFVRIAAKRTNPRLFPSASNSIVYLDVATNQLT